jgi:hypothetical protein
MKTNIDIYSKYFLLLFFSIISFALAKAEDVSFITDAPNAVVKGERFRLTYILSNASGSDLQIKSDISDFDVLFGPSIANSSMTQIINGKRSSSSSQAYTFTLFATKEGTFTLPGASIIADGKTYTSNSVQIRVLPPDKNSNVNQSSSSQSSQGSARSSVPNSSSGSISSSDAFIRTIVSKTKVYEQEALIVTYRLYTTLQVTNVGSIEFPEFNGFIVEDYDLPRNRQLQLEHYNGKNYYSADLKKSLIFHQKYGDLSIPSGKIEMTFNVPSGKVINTFFGPQYVMTDVTKTLVTNPIKLDVLSLPQNRPSSFANAVGSFSITPNISTTHIKANDAIILTLNISGTGNMKLIKTPELKLPTDFEEYDPKITNNFKISTNGLTGTKTIEYLFIPRHEGTFTIPPIEFSYFDVDSKSYKTLSTPEYTIIVDKDPNAKIDTGISYAQSDIKVVNDILHIKTGNVRFIKIESFLVDSLGYYLWFILPALFFVIVLFLYRKQIRENADLIALKTKRANKVATKRLKLAAKYLSVNQKELFYQEVLRATWGYLSDKLVIPVSRLNRENIEHELSNYGASSSLISKFIHVLDTCEFAQYAPAESEAAMDNLYKDAVDAIGEMEQSKKFSK